MSDSYVNMDNARYDDQREVMERIEEARVCPFCPDHLKEFHRQPILRSGEHWNLTPIQWPYEHTSTHLLAIAAYHAETLSDLKNGSFDELQEHLQWAELTYKIAAGGLAMRFGDVTKNGASVKHLHMHLIVPSDDKDPQDKIRFKIS
jgi:diadenosine tetraphosphate (Ap4A) HIT family hydrolase